MRIVDARTGERAELRPRRVGLLRVTVVVGERDGRFDLGDLRALLAGDVLARTCETQGLQVFTGLAVPDGAQEQAGALLKAAEEMGIHPPGRLSAHGDAGTADLVIAGRPQPGSDAVAPALLVTGPVSGPVAGPVAGSVVGSVVEEASDGGPASGSPGSARDPFALRLVLLEHAVTDPVRITAAALADAGERIARWRALVADLAGAPSGPLDADMVQAGFDGLDENLDARVAVRALQALDERSDLAAGTRFETCLRLDQVLALELARDIGRGPR
ncbi:hypothetical protein [Streptomyces rubellomurinus]|uniref:Cysteinyl-tRNA synthetase n=1 Tax=Streptomyces rubellomurinus (strain ATCC 31215) TaxID=359131 RepID=A0A0F2TJD9_STRR3|nr:hypothetical protein [Streptomyces rubellomurinus]KJS63264.1 hypothetical protein VM95_03255 [Streptomyces rubellomurinus]